ncbi:HTH-type transcriptional activator IlvY [Paraferrimonas sp. SM1919]|uniref:HTH-type transcriptional activator IlvY n=1 Tax=Paraferrimonas sp. SM1919 TaxID=2662263 RepID=UPI0013D786B8|nr:HTH-type transcriptional activator IlvY [Paraferrimonas sp. SM1919]
MDIRSLKLFLHLSETLHFARTAQQMHVSPSTLSRCIQRLEDQVGQPVLERDNRSVKLTKAGIQFLRFARQTVDAWQSLRQDMADTSGQLTGEIKLFCSVTAVYSHLPGILERFKQQHPKIEIQLTTGDPDSALAHIQRGQSDIAITARPGVLPEGMEFVDIDTIPLSIIGPAMPCSVQEKLQQSPTPWHELPFILPEHGAARARIDAWFQQMNIQPNIYAKVNGHEALVSMVALGCGVGIAPSVVVENSPVKDRVKSYQTGATIEPFKLGLCASKKKVNQATINAFLQSIEKEAIE